MKNWTIVFVCAAAALFSGIGQSATQHAMQSDAEKIATLEKDLFSTRQRVETMAQELKETRELVAGTVRYVENQARSLQTMAARLDESEQAGFTWGINPLSREILLRAWREHIAEAQKNLPTVTRPVAKGTTEIIAR